MSVLLGPSSSESARFGLRIARGEVGSDGNIDDLARALWRDGVDIGIVRVDARLPASARDFAAQGLPVLHADSLQTWTVPLTQTDAALFRPSDGLRAATQADAEAIGRLIDGSFAAYRSHYAANPLLGAKGGLEGYAEWALSHIGRTDRTCWLQEVDAVAAGLACAGHDDRSGVASGNLHAVHPDFAGRGIYTRLIETTLRHYAALGLRDFTIATQSDNLAVQRVWTRLGLVPARCQHTYHVSPLFGQALAAPERPGEPGRSLREALLQRHAHSLGAGATSDMLLHLPATSTTLQAGFRSAMIARHDGGHAGTTLALAGNGELLGWAISQHIL